MIAKPHATKSPTIAETPTLAELDIRAENWEGPVDPPEDEAPAPSTDGEVES